MTALEHAEQYRFSYGLLESLLHLRSDVESRKYPRSGICDYVYRECILGYPLTKRLMRRWPEYTGNELFPVPSSTERSPGLEFLGTPEYTFFVGPYGKARIRLLDFLIKELQE